MYNLKYDKWKINFGEKIGNGSALFGGIFLTIATFFMFLNMITRTVASYNFRWIYDLCGLCAAVVASFSIPYATFTRQHSNIDTILSHLKPRVRAVSEAVSGIITLLIMVFTIYACSIFAYSKTLALESTTSSHMPTWIFRWLYVIGLILTTIAALLEMIDMFRIAKGETVVNTREELEALEKGMVPGKESEER